VLQPPTWGSTHFSRLLRHAWATVGLFFSPVTTRIFLTPTLDLCECCGFATATEDTTILWNCPAALDTIAKKQDGDGNHRPGPGRANAQW